MSSILTSQGMVFATAMAAVSGTVILLAFRLQKSFPAASQLAIQVNSLPQPPRSCISSDGKKKDKKKKRVHFAEDVVDPIGNGDEYRKLRCNSNYHHNNKNTANFSSSSSSSSLSSSSDESALINKTGGKFQHQMPANRVALYNGILRDRVLHRAAYSY